MILPTENDRERIDDNKRRLDGMTPVVGELLPVRITGGSGGLHAWTMRMWLTGGTRTDHWVPNKGIVNGVGGETATWQPARMPDGTTLTGFPIDCWLRPIVMTSDSGINYEIVTAQSNVARFARFSLRTSLATSMTSVTSCTVDGYWGGTSPGTHITVFNLPASVGFIFNGASAHKGLAAYDEINTKWWIVQLECP